MPLGRTQPLPRLYARTQPLGHRSPRAGVVAWLTLWLLACATEPGAPTSANGGGVGGIGSSGAARPVPVDDTTTGGSSAASSCSDVAVPSATRDAVVSRTGGSDELTVGAMTWRWDTQSCPDPTLELNFTAGDCLRQGGQRLTVRWPASALGTQLIAGLNLVERDDTLTTLSYVVPSNTPPLAPGTWTHCRRQGQSTALGELTFDRQPDSSTGARLTGSVRAVLSDCRSLDPQPDVQVEAVFDEVLSESAENACAG